MVGTFRNDTFSVVNPDPGPLRPVDFDTRNSRLDDVAGSFEDRLKLTSALALIGGVRLEDLTLARNGINFDGTFPAGQPFTKTWKPVSYRAAYTYEPIHDLMFYSMFATAYDPAVAGIFSISPGKSLQLTSSSIYETGAKQLFWDGKAEWTIAAYDILQRNVFVPVTTSTIDVAGEVASQGIELAAAVSPIDGSLWANAAYTHTRFVHFDVWTGMKLLVTTRLRRLDTPRRPRSGASLATYRSSRTRCSARDAACSPSAHPVPTRRCARLESCSPRWATSQPPTRRTDCCSG